MKKTILFLASVLMLATGCYEDYVKDFDKTVVEIAYQYDLRTFVLDEGEQIKFGVGLTGVQKNDRDRKVALVADPSLLDGALACMKDASKVSGTYVVETFGVSDITGLTELPASYYTIDGLDGLTIKKGWHTGSITLKATDLMRMDPKMFTPYYAVAFRIVGADVDEVRKGKDFGVVAVKCENRFYGTWSHCCRIEERNVAGELVGEPRYIPYTTDDGNAYTLTTIDGKSLSCDRVAGESRKMTLIFNGDAITVSSDDGVTGTGRFNGDKLLQNRKLYLDYSYANAAGNMVHVTDTLIFRNRMRDGVREWQDENPENYE